MVRVGKLRLGRRISAACTHYHVLPSAATKPNTPEILDSIVVDNYTHMTPIDYIGLYIIVIASCTMATNWLYRLYF